MHGNRKLLPDVTCIDTNTVDRLAVLIVLTSLVDGDTRLLGVFKLASESGKAVA